MYMTHQPDAIEAVARATVDWLDYREMRNLVARNHNVSMRVTWQAMEDERRLHNLVVALGRGDAQERIAAMLLDFRGRLMHLGLSDGESYRFPMTQQQISDYLGLTVVHVNRILRKLRESGLATVQQRTVVIHDLYALVRKAEPMQDAFERSWLRFGGTEGRP